MREAWLAGLAVVALAGTPARADEWSHRYPVKGTPDLHVKTDDGSVHVETSDAAEIEARVTTEGWKIAPGEVTIIESQTGDRVDLEVRLPKQVFGFHTGHRKVSVLLRVPKTADLDVHTGDGSIEAQPVSGRLRLSTGDGSITAEGLEGDVRLHSGDGSIKAKGLSGRLNAETGDGSMDVRGRFEVLDLHTGDGSIEAAAESGSKLEEAWSLSSGDGSITLRLPDGLGADLDAHTGDGGIVLERPASLTGTVHENTVRGKLGPGGLLLKVRTGDGSIRLLGS